MLLYVDVSYIGFENLRKNAGSRKRKKYVCLPGEAFSAMTKNQISKKRVRESSGSRVWSQNAFAGYDFPLVSFGERMWRKSK